MDGLRIDIRAVVLVARPSTLDTACTLALLQEEAADEGINQEPKRSDSTFQHRSGSS